MKLLAVIAWVSCFCLWPFQLEAERQTLHVICDIWPPYQMVEDNGIGGFSTRIVQAVFDKMGIRTLKIKPYPWKRAVVMIKNGSADALFSANHTEERALFAHYPEEMIVQSPWVMWVRGDSGLKYDALDDLRGKRVGVVRGYSYTPEFLDFVGNNAFGEEVLNDVMNFKKLNAGRVDFVVAEQRNGHHITRELGFRDIVPLEQTPVKVDGLYIIFNKRNVPPTLVEEFSEELKKFKQSPRYRNLRYRYFTFPHPSPDPLSGH